MHRLAIKRTTKNEAHLSPNTHVTAFVGPRVGTVPFGATADRCADTADCSVPVYAQRCADCEFARGTIGYHSNS